MGRYEDVAIIGMSGLFPEAANLDEFHRNLLEARDSVRSLSLDRMSFTSVDPSQDYVPLGYLDRVDLFDHRFFNISPREAEFMDPHQRLTLQLVCAAIENAGYGLEAFNGTETGVFLSAPRPEYLELFTEVDPLELLGNAPSALAGRISFFLDLRGPSFVLDAGCCASLVAVEHARRELSVGDCRYAIAGGLSLTLLFEASSVNSRFAEIMSPDARCKAFDASANGAAAGEGGGIVVLKRLGDAVADGDHIHAVVRGGAVNQNGFRAFGLSAPSPAAQRDVVLAAWDDAGVDASTISFIEAHGSGTRLGDVIEAQALREAFAERGVAPKSCALSSVKTNIGHLDHAAGIAGFIKAVLALENRTLYRSLHFETPNPLIDLDDSAIYVQERSVEWDAPPGGIRRAGVSSFSLAGTNVHMVLEEAPIVALQPSTGRRELATLSARSATAFERYRSLLADFVSSTHLPLETIVHTLNRGRSDHEYRAAAAIGDRDELIAWLRSTIGAETAPVEVAILFSADAAFEPEQLEQLAGIWPGAAAVLDSLKAGDVDPFDEAVGTFASHLCVHAALRDLGIREIAVLGSGVGNAAVRVVRSEISAAEGARLAREWSISATADVGKLVAALRTLDPAGTLFVETAAGELGAAIRSLNGEARVLEVAGDPLDAAAHLYRAGASIDWDHYYAGRTIPRVQLPTYPFDEERSWCRQPGEHRASSPGYAALTAPQAGGENVLGAAFASETQARLAAIWEAALGVAPDDASADYFELGGTSITGMSVLDGIERDFGMRLMFADLYDHSRLGDLATRVDVLALHVESDRASEPELVSIPREGYLPVSIGQEQIWFLDQLEPNSPLYNIPFDLHIRGPLDESALQRAIAGLAARHEVLRTSFVSVEGEARAVVEDRPTIDVPIVDLSHLAPAARRSEGLRQWDAEASKPFDLSKGPLFRARLLRLANAEHVLLITIHHIIYDGWTPSIIQGELAALYEEESTGRPAELSPLVIQYADYASWQRRWVESPAIARDLAYWQEHLAGAPELEIPTDHPRPPDQTYRGEMITFDLDAELIDSLRALSRSQSVTLFTTMLAAICILMQRYSGQDDVVIGTPTSGRKRAEIRGLIGYFNNMLPVRCDLSGDPTFVELMHRVRRVVAGALDHDELPFEKMVEVLRPDRDLARNPLFQVAYSHQNTPQEGYTLPGMEVDNFAEGSIRGIAPGTSKFDLTIGVGDGGEGELEGYFEYATDLFERATIEAMITHVEQLLRSISQDPGAPLSSLQVMPEEELRALLHEECGPVRSHELRPVHEAIAERAAATPDAIAVAGDEVLTYAALDARANRLAHHLLSLGVDVEDRVAIVLPRTVDLIVSQLAAMKAGGAFVALDPVHPTARAAGAIADAGAAALISTSDVAVPKVSGAAVVLVDLDAPAIAACSSDPPPVTVHPDNAAYVIYTSGSTGAPKGVVVTHRSLINLCGWHIDEYSIDSTDKAVHLAPLAFDATVWETWPYLVAGASLSLVADIHRIDPEVVRDRFVDEEITIAFVPTGLVYGLLDARWPQATRLRALLTGGDRLLKAPSRDFPARLVNHYGPTENTVVATAIDVLPDDVDMPPIGRPIDNVSAYVLDAHLQPVPTGALGELYLAGEGLARGYVGRSDLTAERFQPDPYSPKPGARMYATGDVARRRRDGVLEFVGRRDHQVKVRGFRVELGEIEHTLASHPHVAEAVVVASPIAAGRSTQLVAYVAPRDGRDLSPDEVERFATEFLPEYMVPRTVVPVATLPRTPNGKVDRDALPHPEVSSKDAGARYREPRSPTERTLAQIWAEVLGVDRVGIDDNFFDLGGDSIVSIQIVARANAAGVRIGAKDMFRGQTVEALARCAMSGRRRAAAEQGRVMGTLPLTPIQLWFLELQPADPDHFDQAMLLEAPADVDVDALSAALEALTDHHDALRLRVVRGAEGWQAHIADDPGEVLTVVEADSALDAIADVAADLHSSLDLADGPIVRAALVRASTSARLVLVIHHFAVDAVSWPILIEDLEAAYDSALGGAAISLPAKTTSIAERATRLHEYARSSEVDREVEYWRRLLDGPGGRLIGDREGPNVAGGSASVEIEFDAATTRLFTEKGVAASRATVQEALLACLVSALRDRVDGPVVDIDIEGHGREDVGGELDVSRTVGWFTSIFPVRVPLDDAHDVTDTVAIVKDIMRSTPRRGIGFGVLRYLSRSDDLRATAQPEVSFNYLGGFSPAIRGGKFTATDGPAGSSTAAANERAHVLDVEAQIEEGRLMVTWTYSENRHERTSIERLARRFTDALRRLVDRAHEGVQPSPTPTDFPLANLDSRSLQRVLARTDDVDDIYPLSSMQQGLLFHSLFDPTSGVYLEQLNFVIRGSLDPKRFSRAWAVVSTRHDMLRSAVAWEGLDEPVHVIRRNARPPFAFEDLSELDADEAERRLEAYFEEDLRRGFDLAIGPLMRIVLFRHSAQIHRVVWTHHHLILDGWSVQLLLGEVWAAYGAMGEGLDVELEAPGSYRDFISWVRTPAGDEALSYWRTELAGLATPTRMPLPPPAEPGEGYELATHELSVEETRGLEEFARAARLTVATIAQGVWAQLLALYTGTSDVVFGATVSGRSADIPAVERTVGLFINTIPIRVQVDPAAGVGDWLRELQERLVAGRWFEQMPLVELQSFTDIPSGVPMFESVIAFENYPLDPVWEENAGNLSIESDRYVEQTNYPLAIVIAPTDRLTIRISYDRARFGRAEVDRLAKCFLALLKAFAADPSAPVEEATLSVAAEVVPVREATRDIAPTPAVAEYVAPRTRTEDVLASIWTDILEVDKVGARDNFFGLGGHSLLATRLASRIADVLGLDVSVRAVFDHPVLEDLASYLSSARGGPRTREEIASTVAAVQGMSDEEVAALLAVMTAEDSAEGPK